MGLFDVFKSKDGSGNGPEMFECTRCKKKYVLKSSADKCLSYHRDQEWKGAGFNPEDGLPKVIQSGEEWMDPLSKQMFKTKAEAEQSVLKTATELGFNGQATAAQEKQSPTNQRLKNILNQGKTVGIKIQRDGISHKCPICTQNHAAKDNAIACLKKCADKEGFLVLDLGQEAKVINLGSQFQCPLCSKKHFNEVDAKICIDVCKTNSTYKLLSKEIKLDEKKQSVA